MPVKCGHCQRAITFGGDTSWWGKSCADCGRDLYLIRRQYGFESSLEHDQRDTPRMRVMQALHSMTSSDDDVVEAARNSLGRLGQDAVEALAEVLNCATGYSWYERGAVADALGAIGGDKVLNFLAQAMDDPERSLRHKIPAALARLGSAAIPSLVSGLSHPDDFHRGQIVRALAHLADRGTVQPLIGMLQDQSVDVRDAAIGALSSLRDPSAIEPLLGVMKNIPEKTGRIMWALVEIGAAAVPPIISILKDNTAAVELRIEAAQALGRTADPRAVRALIDVLCLSEGVLRVGAASALERIANVKPLLEFGDAIEPLRRMSRIWSGTPRADRVVFRAAFEASRRAVRQAR